LTGCSPKPEVLLSKSGCLYYHPWICSSRKRYRGFFSAVSSTGTQLLPPLDLLFWSVGGLIMMFYTNSLGNA
jgi:hypothetical protein